MAAKRVAAAKVNGQTALERACGRAAAAGLTVAGRGYRKSDFALVWFIPSQHEANRWYQVTQVGAHMECACRGYRDFAQTCAHIGAVCNDLAAEARAFAAAQAAAQVASIGSARVLTADEIEQQRDTAPLARDNKPFSLFKAS
ncbi:MAG TPA: hypothetical protein VMV29_20875 [Ktedonobacterales bacterium]|nr:hypothetical protein [Ktedonobacterales bacterium]